MEDEDLSAGVEVNENSEVLIVYWRGEEPTHRSIEFHDPEDVSLSTYNSLVDHTETEVHVFDMENLFDVMGVNPRGEED